MIFNPHQPFPGWQSVRLRCNFFLKKKKRDFVMGLCEIDCRKAQASNIAAVK